MSDDGEPPNWGTVIVGVLLLLGAAFAYWGISRMEASGGSMRINVIFAMLYKLLGKWGVVGSLAFLGAAACWVGYSPPRSDDD